MAARKSKVAAMKPPPRMAASAMPGVLAVEVMIVFPFVRDAFTEFRVRQSLAAENRPAVAGRPRTDRPEAAGQEKSPGGSRLRGLVRSDRRAGLERALHF